MKKNFIFASLFFCLSANSAQITWNMRFLNSVEKYISKVGLDSIATCPNGAWAIVRRPHFFDQDLTNFNSKYFAPSFAAADRQTVEYRELELNIDDSFNISEKETVKEDKLESVKQLFDLLGAKSPAQDAPKVRQRKYTKNVVGYSWTDKSPVKVYLFKPKIVFNEYEEAAFSEGIINLAYDEIEGKANYKNTFTVFDENRGMGRYIYEMTSKDGGSFVLDGDGDWIYPNGKLGSISSEDFPSNGGFKSEYERRNKGKLLGFKSIKSILGNFECKGNSIFGRSVHRIFLGGDADAIENYGYLLIEREVRLNPKVEPDKSKKFGF